MSDEAVIKLAKKLQTTELNIRREYFQHLFLSYFYKQSQTEHIYFKGGTALRLLYNSPRFSEDLDFSATFNTWKSIESPLIATLAEIEREGIKTNLEEAKPTTGGYLSIIHFRGNDHTVAIQMEVSLREKTKKGELNTVSNDFMPSYTVMLLSKKELIEEKIKALFTRKKPRDFYDFYFFLRSNLLTAEQKNACRDIPDLLRGPNLSFSKELKEFLPKSHWPLLQDFPAVLLREIQRFL